jgi:hypothetical protein
METHEAILMSFLNGIILKSDGNLTSVIAIRSNPVFLVGG